MNDTIPTDPWKHIAQCVESGDVDELAHRIECAETDAVYWEMKYKGTWPGDQDKEPNPNPNPNNLPDNDIEFLLLLVPDWARQVPEEDLDPTFYGTGSRENDQTIVNRIRAIKRNQALAEEKEPEPEPDPKPTAKIIPKWFYKLTFVVCSKIAAWAMKKAGIKPDQHKKAEEGTKRIKNASDEVEDTKVDVKNRPDDDLFNNTDFNS